ncbi:SH3Y1-like protein, partial [Mya arenaria]
DPDLYVVSPTTAIFAEFLSPLDTITMVNTPIPHSLKSEAKKAAKILKEFTVPTAKMGPDKLIPAGIFMKAKGLAILTVVKAGFLVTARGGSGIVIAKLDEGIDSGWSAPSAIGIAGLGGGFEIGAEVTDFVIILNKRSAVEAFSKGGNLTLGGNFTIAAGPLGRNLEADVALRSTAAIYTYSKTRGLFAGISVEGSALIERKDANRKFYGHDIRAVEILRGDVDKPDGCECLYEVLESHRKKAEKELINMAKRKAMKAVTGDTENMKSKFSSFTSSFKSKKPSDKTDYSGADTYSDSDDESYKYSPSKETKHTRHVKTVTSTTVIKKRTSGGGKSRPSSMMVPSKDSHSVSKTASAISRSSPRPPRPRSFSGDVISVLTRTETQNDWWEGSCRGNTGIFPANYVKVNT